ncbi:MAG: 30S ribosomal protein S11 [Verrucomicrobiia bacterium]
MAEENAQPEEEEKKEAVTAPATEAKAPKAEVKPPKAEAEAPKAEEEAPKAKAKAPKAEVEAPSGDDAEESAKEAEEELAPGGVKKQPTAQELLKEEIGDLKIRKAKGSKNVTTGIAKVSATFNNTIVTITDTKGNTISWASAGKMNFRGSRKSTAYAAQVVTQNAAKAAMSHGLKEVVIHVKGPGMGRDSAIRAFQSLGLEITSIVDTTPIPHNGCRPPKRRRV